MLRYSLFTNGRYVTEGTSPTAEAAINHCRLELRERGLAKGEAKVWPQGKNSLDYKWIDLVPAE